MLKKIILLLAIMMMSFVIAGCSKGTDSGSSPKDEKQSGTKAEETVQPGKADDLSNDADKYGGSDNLAENIDKTGASSDETAKSEKNSGKKDRNLVTKFYELVSIDGHTRSEFQADEDLCSDYNAWEFAEYGTGIVIDFDYDEGYVQYTWQSITQNAYSSAPIDNPSGTMDILAFSFDPGEDIGRSEVWDTVDVSYSDEVITVTYSGGCVEVYKLQ